MKLLRFKDTHDSSNPLSLTPYTEYAHMYTSTFSDELAMSGGAISRAEMAAKSLSVSPSAMTRLSRHEEARLTSSHDTLGSSQATGSDTIFTNRSNKAATRNRQNTCIVYMYSEYIFVKDLDCQFVID